MKKHLFLSMIAIGLAMGAVQAQPAPKGKYAEGEAIVALRHTHLTKSEAAMQDASGKVKDYVQAVASKAGANVVTVYNALSSSAPGVIAHVKSTGNETTEELIARLKSDPDVISVQPNYKSYLAGREPNDPFYTDGSLWNMKKINAPAAWSVTTGDTSGKQYVVVLDSGVKTDHEDLAGNVAVEYCADVTGEEDITDKNGHGTKVCGIIGAVGDNNKGVVGVNWKTNIISIKIADGKFGDNIEDAYILAGYDLVKDMIDNQNLDIVAVNYSVGGWKPVSPENIKETPYYMAFKAMEEKTVIVVAACNDGEEVGVSDKDNLYCYPPSFIDVPNMIVVGAIDSRDAAYTQTNWSAEKVDILAPGVNVYSTSTSSSSYSTSTGTSDAAPHVAGAIALLKTVHPDWAPAQLKQAILDAANANVNPTTGPVSKWIHVPKPNDGKPISKYGLLDVGKAINAGTGITSITNYELRITVKNGELRMENYKGDGNVQIFDVSGRTALAPSSPSFSSSISLNIASLPSGVYIVKAGNKSAKFIK